MVLFDCAPSCQSKLHHQGGNIQYCRLQAQATKDKDNIERGVTGTESPKAGHTWGLIPGGILHKILPASFLSVVLAHFHANIFWYKFVPKKFLIWIDYFYEVSMY